MAPTRCRAAPAPPAPSAVTPGRSTWAWAAWAAAPPWAPARRRPGQQSAARRSAGGAAGEGGMRPGVRDRETVTVAMAIAGCTDACMGQNARPVRRLDSELVTPGVSMLYQHRFARSGSPHSPHSHLHGGLRLGILRFRCAGLPHAAACEELNVLFAEPRRPLARCGACGAQGRRSKACCQHPRLPLPPLCSRPEAGLELPCRPEKFHPLQSNVSEDDGP